MVTTIAIDDDLANRFREAVRRFHAKSHGKIKEEMTNALENHIIFMEQKCVLDT